MIRAVLFDADGVLQSAPAGTFRWFGDLFGELGEKIGVQIFAELPEFLTGEGDMVARVGEVLAGHGLADQTQAALDLWRQFGPVPQTRALVGEVRAAGVPCYLATNQDNWRAVCMREELDYQTLLDGTYYSCDIGVAKPDPAYFEYIAADLGYDVGDLIFIDDSPPNVDGARTAGLTAIHWNVGVDDIAELRAALVGFGVLA